MEFKRENFLFFPPLACNSFTIMCLENFSFVCFFFFMFFPFQLCGDSCICHFKSLAWSWKICSSNLLSSGLLGFLEFLLQNIRREGAAQRKSPEICTGCPHMSLAESWTVQVSYNLCEFQQRVVPGNRVTNHTSFPGTEGVPSTWGFRILKLE